MHKYLVSILALTLAACAGSDGTSTQWEVAVEGEESLAPSWEEYRASAKLLAPNEDYFIAEGDLYFETEEELRLHYEENLEVERLKLAVFQQISTGYEPVYEGNDALDIVYCVSNSFTNKSTAITDIASAISDWQKVINVRFRYSSSQDATCNQNNTNVDFAFMPTSIAGLMGCGANKMGWTSGCRMADGTRARGVLLANYGEWPMDPGPWSGLTMRGNLRHELGHVLGFRHEHPWAPSLPVDCDEAKSFGDTTGRRLTSYDQQSVMHYPDCAGIPGADQTISVKDGIGARSIYGMPASWYVPSILYPVL